MTDLTVKLYYRSSVRSILQTMIRFSFPLWGIVLPLATPFAMLCTSSYQWSTVVFAFGFLAVVLALMVVGFRLSKLVEKEYLIADKNGIELPSIYFSVLHPLHVAWTSISRIEAAESTPGQWSVVFYVGENKPIALDCGRLLPSEVEQLLLAIQLWAPAQKTDGSLTLLQDTLKSQAMLTDKRNLDPSYTALWEEELHRRFRQVAFLPLAPGAVIRNGSLSVVRQLAMGGLSAIYLCQLDGRDLVVLKESVTPEDAVPELKTKAEELFAREAKILMGLSHPHVVKVLDHFVENGRSYLMLEYQSGQDLRQNVKQHGPVRESVVVEWANQIVSVLEYLHTREKPVIHRDLTPDNIVVRNDGNIVVIDFGAANEFIGTCTGTFVGKQCYIAPEQFRGKATPQSDIYAFGCTLHFLLTGKDPEALSTSHPKQINALVSEAMDAFVAECTDTSLAARIESSSALRAKLDAIVAQSGAVV